MRTFKNSIFILFLALCCCGTAFGQQNSKQTKKRTAQAMEKVQKLNKAIVAGDESAALTDEQVASLTEVFLDMSKQLRTAKKEGGTKEEQKARMKASRKATNKTINKELLTKQQRQAKKAGKQ